MMGAATQEEEGKPAKKSPTVTTKRLTTEAASPSSEPEKPYGWSEPFEKQSKSPKKDKKEHRRNYYAEIEEDLSGLKDYQHDRVLRDLDPYFHFDRDYRRYDDFFDRPYPRRAHESKYWRLLEAVELDPTMLLSTASTATNGALPVTDYQHRDDDLHHEHLMSAVPKPGNEIEHHPRHEVVHDYFHWP